MKGKHGGKRKCLILQLRVGIYQMLRSDYAGREGMTDWAVAF